MTIEEELKKAVSKAEKDLRTAIENRPFDKHLLSAYGIKYNDACLDLLEHLAKEQKEQTNDKEKIMSKVYYLCSSPDDKGVVFATELPKDYTSFGSFYVEEASDGQEYDFPARMNGSTVVAKLTKKEDNLYTAHYNDLGEFIFKRVPSGREDVYVGKDPKLHGKKLMMIGCPDKNASDILEIACLEYDFYFIGYGAKE